MNEDKAARYHRLRRRTDLLALLWSGSLLCALVGTGGARALRDLAKELVRQAGPPVGWAPLATVAIYVVVLAVLYGSVALPLAYHRGFVLERRFGLSRQSARSWTWNHLKVMAMTLAFATCAACVTYGVLTAWPQWWWMAAWALFLAASVALAQLGPVLLLPVLFTLVPLRNAALHDRLIALAARAGTDVLHVQEWRMSDRTSRVQAALVGVGPTRRILLSDTLLSDYSDDEVEVILAHEIGHHVGHDFRRGLVFEALLSLTGGVALGLTGPGDVAGLPAMLLASGVLSLLTIPVANALSRWTERRADRFALELTGHPDAFVAAMRRMGAQNLAEERPSRFALGFFYTHPPVAERIGLAQRWAASSRTGSVASSSPS
jgi:STE24 endopeptidase